MKQLVFIVALFSGIIPVMSQSKADSLYIVYVTEGKGLYQSGEYLKSAEAYKKAFDQYGGKAVPNDRYNAACSYALSANSKKALFHLHYLSDSTQFSDIGLITTDTDLNSLHDTKEWDKLIEKVKANKYELEKDFDQDLITKLDSLKTLDQKWRKMSTDYANGTIDSSSTSREEIMENVRATDSLNYLELKSIVEKHGFPGFDLVGKNGSHNFWLMIQHQDRNTDFQIEVLTLMKKQVDVDNANKNDYAYLVDRVRVNTGKLQVYGTQMTINEDRTSYMPKPVEDPDNLNKRRLEMNLSPIETYIDIMNKHFHGSLTGRKNQ